VQHSYPVECTIDTGQLRRIIRLFRCFNQFLTCVNGPELVRCTLALCKGAKNASVFYMTTVIQTQQIVLMTAGEETFLAA